MAKKILFIFMFVASNIAAQVNSHDQYSFEGGYGLGISGKPGITQLSHFDVGFRYMITEYWGVKFDFGSDQFRTDKEGYEQEIGTDYRRLSFNVVNNLGREINMRGNLGLLAHAGFGYSWIKPVGVSTIDQVDSIGNVIIGITPQYYIIKNIALHADVAYIVNFSQHKDFDGFSRYTGVKSFVGGLANVSVGITFYFGPNGSNADWR
ncbi:hypothetical protein ACLI09_16145 [Flavobacterium sp. RHBU_24]|uniref:hypothetical protein n=1 Tax=Flavobacterium sp. RHBU_24 TaxID=3391185 RepID=UPI00398521F2